MSKGRFKLELTGLEGIQSGGCVGLRLDFEVGDVFHEPYNASYRDDGQCWLCLSIVQSISFAFTGADF